MPFTLDVNTAGLTAGYHTSSLTIESSAGTAVLPVSVRIIARPAIRLGPQGVHVRTHSGSAPGNPNGALSVSVDGAGAVRWTASVTSGSEWLRLTSTAGTASSRSPGAVSYTVDPASLWNRPPQTYYGTIRVSSTDSVESHLDFDVVLEVLSASTPVKPEPQPAGLIFDTHSSAAGNSQSVSLYASSSSPIPYQASVSTADGGNWLTVSPSTGFASASAPGASTVAISSSGLRPGVYRGGVSYAFSSEAVRTVNVTLIV